MLLSGPVALIEPSGLYVVTILGGSLHKLRDDGIGAVVSWDNSRIAYLGRRLSEIWICGGDGEQARRLLTAAAGESFSGVAWDPSGRRIAYLKRQRGGYNVDLAVLDLVSGESRILFSDPRLTTFTWAPDGRLIYGLIEPAPNDNSENLWQVRVDENGRLLGSARRLTQLAGFQFAYLRPTRDGQRISFVRWRHQSDVWVLRRIAGQRFSNAERLTTDERIDWPGGWTRDSKAVLFYSDRNGELDIFRKSLSSQTAELLVPSVQEKRDPQLSPDGAWLIYMAWDKPSTALTGRVEGIKGRLVRMPLAGGPSKTIFEVVGYPGLPRVALDDRLGVANKGQPHFHCPSTASHACIVSELDGRELVFTAFDPVAGRLGEIMRLDIDPANLSFWDLSRDGRRIVFGQSQRETRLQLFDVRDRSVISHSELRIPEWPLVEGAAWSADGQHLFLTAFRSNGSPLLMSDMRGRTTVLHKALLLGNPVSSPDGRYLAFGEVTADSNAWVLHRVR